MGDLRHHQRFEKTYVEGVPFVEVVYEASVARLHVGFLGRSWLVGGESIGQKPLRGLPGSDDVNTYGYPFPS
ncbi:Os10g0453101 [Oryza sativa Japonica Group]|uniref:Os10g0453101 protein n=1 Tax=Oryza sativa subsp. japonica TaxID=39947 RepID=A0A0P0XVD3_ORYSJ|nr:Os10g0453101 [Oryza sativa Japonica Group]